MERDSFQIKDNIIHSLNIQDWNNMVSDSEIALKKAYDIEYEEIDNLFDIEFDIDVSFKRLISDLKVTLCEVKINKQNPKDIITTSLQTSEYENKALVLVDDVLNSGATLIYGVKHFLDVPLSKFKTAVLIDRNHKKYPVKADFKGISLSTSLLEHVQVVFEEKGDYAYLS